MKPTATIWHCTVTSQRPDGTFGHSLSAASAPPRELACSRARPAIMCSIVSLSAPLAAARRASIMAPRGHTVPAFQQASFRQQAGAVLLSSVFLFGGSSQAVATGDVVLGGKIFNQSCGACVCMCFSRCAEPVTALLAAAPAEVLAAQRRATPVETTLWMLPRRYARRRSASICRLPQATALPKQRLSTRQGVAAAEGLTHRARA